jgi:prophage maintenance system killer protein
VSDTIYLTFEQVADLNARHCGPGAGVLNEEGIRAQLGRAEATFMGTDLYPSVWEKAAVLFHGVSSTQYFHDGNKRTAWIVADLFLSINGHPLKDIEPIAGEAFVLSIATRAFETDEDPERGVRKAAEWLATHALRMKDRKAFAILAKQAEWAGDGDSTFDAVGAALAGVVADMLPAITPLAIVFEIGWHPLDAGREFAIRFTVENVTGSARLVVPADKAIARLLTGDVLTEADVKNADSELTGTVTASALTMHEQHGVNVVIPTMYLTPMIVEVQTEGLCYVRVDVGGELFARLPLSIGEYGEVSVEGVTGAHEE